MSDPIDPVDRRRPDGAQRARYGRRSGDAWPADAGRGAGGRGHRLPDGQRGGRGRRRAALAAAAQPAGHRLHRPAHRGPAAGAHGAARLPPRPAAQPHPQRQPVVAAGGGGHLLRRLPVARLPLGAAHPRHRLPAQDARRDRDHLHQLAGQLRGAGQAGRRLPRLPAARDRPGGAQHELRHHLHRAHLRPLRHRPAGAHGRLLELPQQHARDRAHHLRHRAASWSRCWRWDCSWCETSAAASSSGYRCRSASWPCTTCSSRASSRSSAASCRSSPSSRR